MNSTKSILKFIINIICNLLQLQTKSKLYANENQSKYFYTQLKFFKKNT